jgi:leader peptidase (prepilin peptidase) / N-methyltransferase
MQTTILGSLESVLGIPGYFGYIFSFVLGSCIGSFLNVVIYRVPNELSLMTGSACPNCKKAIRFYHNIPILGWLMLGGKCANCKRPIAWRYPAVELLTAVMFCLVFWQIGFTPYLPVALVFVSAMMALIFIDSEHMILPNVITYPLFAAALLVRLLFPLTFSLNYFSDLAVWPLTSLYGYPMWLISLAGALLGALAGGGSLWLVGEIWKRFRGVEAMGLGDVKMMLGVGALLGWRLSLLTIFLGAFTGAIVGVAMILVRRDKGLQTQIPFGIFLGAGSVIALLFGEQLVGWYLRMYQ